MTEKQGKTEVLSHGNLYKYGEWCCPECNSKTSSVMQYEDTSVVLFCQDCWCIYSMAPIDRSSE